MDRIYLGIFYLFRFVTISSPKFFLDFVLKCGALFFYTIDKKHRKIAKVNLDLAYGNNLCDEQKIKIIKKCYKNLVYTLADFLKNQGAKKEKILSKVRFHDEKLVLDEIKKGQNIIIMTAHYGNWELLSLGIAAKLFPLSVVGRDLDSPIMNKILEKNREQFDIELLSKTGAMKGMIKALKIKRPIGILVDQNTSDSEGILIDFFGKKARHTPSAAILAKKFDALIVPAFITTNDYEIYDIRFYEPITINDSGDKEKDILECVQAQADITQKIIEEKPDEWFWLHQRWKNQYEYLYK